MTRLTILDTTLRDGDQAALFSAEHKLAIARALEEAGADIIETGFPCSSASEAEVCARIARELSALTAVFCRARVSDIRASARVFREGRGVLHISLPASRINIEAKLGVSEARVIGMMREAVSCAKGLCLRVEAGAEDASRADRAFLAEYCEAAREAGADIVNIADTLGLFTPDSVRSLVSALVPIAPVSIHCHNDMGLATANTLAAVSAGAVQAEVSVSGLGERAGNASFEEVALHYGTGVCGTGIRIDRLGALTRLVAEASGIASPSRPVSGWGVLTHSAGLHLQALQRNGESYAIPAVRDAGAARERIALSRLSGRSGAALFALRYCRVRLSDAEARAVSARIKASEEAVGITELLGILFDMGLVKRAPLTLTAFREEFGAESYTVSAETGGRAAQGRGGTEAAACEGCAAAIGEAAGLGAVAVTRTLLTGAGGRLRVYAEVAAGGRLYPLERVGAHAGRLLLLCCMDALNAAVRAPPR
jgi:2-isopropylmalate synthase